MSPADLTAAYLDACRMLSGIVGSVDWSAVWAAGLSAAGALLGSRLP